MRVPTVRLLALPRACATCKGDVAMSATGLIQMYLARDWRLLVCKPRSKEPLTAHGVKDATSDPEVIAEWRRRWPDANWAVATGRPGPMALDIDDQAATPADVLKAVARAPRTASARGGCAFFEGTDARTIVLDYGELRGVGSYQMIPPSIHPTGKAYVWIQEPHGKLPTVPKLVAANKNTSGAGVAPKVLSIPPEGGMHEHLKKLAVRLVRAGVLSQQTITTVLLAEFDARRSAPAAAYGGSERDTLRIAEWAVGDSYLADHERERRVLGGTPLPVAAPRPIGGAE
jgi:hypothetical protein